MSNVVKMFPASLSSLQEIREFVFKKCTSMDFNKKKTYGLCLAVEEIATNIITHGYPKAGIGLGIIEVDVQDAGKQLTVTLKDSAVAFDPLQHHLHSNANLNMPPDERPVGGLGILLAMQNVDEFKYERNEQFNANLFIIHSTS